MKLYCDSQPALHDVNMQVYIIRVLPLRFFSRSRQFLHEISSCVCKHCLRQWLSTFFILVHTFKFAR